MLLLFFGFSCCLSVLGMGFYVGVSCSIPQRHAATDAKSEGVDGENEGPGLLWSVPASELH